MIDRKLPPKRLFPILALAVAVLLGGGVTGHLLAPRPRWSPNLRGQVQLAVERVLDAPAVRYRGSLNGGLVSFDVTMTEHGEGYGVARKSGVMVELMLVDGVVLLKGNDAYWDSQSEDLVRYTDAWIRASPTSMSTFVNLAALTPTAVKAAVTSATRGDVQLQVTDWGWRRHADVKVAVAGNGVTAHLKGSGGRLTQLTGTFGQLGSEVQLDITPVDHATAMTTYNLLVQVAQKHPGYIDPDLRFTVVRHRVTSCGPTSCQVQVTARNDRQRPITPRLEVLFFADSAYSRYITGCTSALPTIAPGATVTGACAVRDAQWQRWVYLEQPGSVYFVLTLTPHVTSTNPPRQPTP